MLYSKLSLALAAALLVSAPLLAQNAVKPDESKLIATLTSDAPQKEKADACRELGVYGTKAAVAPLATLLSDEKMSHMARYALETIPDPAVDDALRAALGQVKGRLLAGVIGSIGVRKDTKAIQPLSSLLQDGDPDIAQAAARALGKIGTAESAKAIEGGMSRTPEANKLAFCEGLFRCAEALTNSGQRDEAIRIYDGLRKVQGIHQVRAGALRGAILSRESAGIPLLVEAIKSDDWVLVDAAARTAIEMPGSGVTKAIADELPNMTPDKQILFVQVLGRRGNADGLPALYTMSKSGQKSVRVAAIRNIPQIGQASSAASLISLLADGEREIAQAAQDALAGLQGAEVDRAVLAMLNGTDSNQRVIATDLIARRRMSSAMPDLLKAASAEDGNVRQSALKRVGELGTEQNLPALLTFLLESKNEQDTDAAEQAISTVCTKASQPQACAEQVVAALGKASPVQKGALLRVLSAIGGEKALVAVRAAVGDPAPQVHSAAIRALGSWESADAAPHLLALARTSQDPKDKMLCFRSYLNLASSHTDLPPARRLAMCKEATDLVQKPDEKKLFLSTLGSIISVDSLAVISPYLDDAAVKEEASAASITVAEKLMKARDAAKSAQAVVTSMEKVIKTTANDNLSQKAKGLLQQALTKGGIKPT